MSSNIRVKENVELQWTGNQWELEHAIDFWRKGHWTLDFAANWLGVTEDELWKLATKTCPNCNGKGVIWRDK